jgi:hypothetical protein
LVTKAFQPKRSLTSSGKENFHQIIAILKVSLILGFLLTGHIMKEEEITILHGTHIWKSGLEYFNEKMFLHGNPYYQITEVGGVYYLWELDRNDPDSYNYHIMQQSDNFIHLHEKGMELNDALWEKYESMNLFHVTGKKLIEKLNSAQ